MCDRKWRDVILEHEELWPSNRYWAFYCIFDFIISLNTQTDHARYILFCPVQKKKKFKKAKTWANKSQIMSQDLKSSSSGSKTHIFPIP